MQVLYCDKCKKKIKKEKDIPRDHSRILIFSGHDIFDTQSPIELCGKCAEKFSKIVKKFIQAK